MIFWIKVLPPIIAIVAWAAIYLMFYSARIKRWWAGRAKRRETAENARRERAEAQKQLADELAAKYLPPKDGADTAARGEG